MFLRNDGKVHSQLHDMRRLGVNALDIFIEGLVETKERVKEAVTRIYQTNSKEKLQDISCEIIIRYRFRHLLLT